MAYFKATIEVLIDVEDETDACDALSEALRPILNRFADKSAIVDWRYHDSELVPSPHSGDGFA